MGPPKWGGPHKFDDHYDQGLGQLLSPAQDVGEFFSSGSLSLQDAIAYVIDASDDCSAFVLSRNGDSDGNFIDWTAVSSKLEQRLAESEAEFDNSHEESHTEGTEQLPAEGEQQQEGHSAAAGSSGAATATAASSTSPPSNAESQITGRVGPRRVSLVPLRGTSEIRPSSGVISVLSRSGFSTVRGSVAVFRGKWLFEVQLGSSGILQIGWTPPNAQFNSDEGVGDTQDSYAYDGKRMRKWNIRAAPYGERWTSGDIITCGVDLDAGTVSYWRNGTSLGVAFTGLRGRAAGLAYLPAVSLSYCERCEVNFGGRPLEYPQEGYEPLQAAPSAGAIARASFLTRCWNRLNNLTEKRLESAARSPRSAAAAAATKALQTTASSSSDASDDASIVGGGEDEHRILASPHGGVASLDNQLKALNLDPSSSTATDIGAATPPPSSSSTYKIPAAEVKLQESRPLFASITSIPPTPISALHYTSDSAPIDAADAMLLAGIIAQQYGPLCFDAYLVDQVLLPELREYVPHEACYSDGTFFRMLNTLCAVLEPEELQSLASMTVESAARAIRGCVWHEDLDNFPASKASMYLHDVEIFMRCHAFRQAWLDHIDTDGNSTWQSQLEALLEVRQPPPGELESLLPHLKWQGEGNSGMELAASTSDGAFAEDYKALIAMHKELERAQFALMRTLCNWAEGTRTSSSDGNDDAKPGIESLVSCLAVAAQQNALMPCDSSTMERSMALVGELVMQSTGSDFLAQDIQNAVHCQLEEALAEVGDGHSQIVVPQPLGAFLQWLEVKNAGALRDVPPPGLSAPSVLPSVFSILLRMLRPLLFDNIHVHGGAFEFPSGFFFRGVETLAADTSNRNGNRPRVPEPASRLGGTLTHLIRERLVSEDENLGDVHVDAVTGLGELTFFDAVGDDNAAFDTSGLCGVWQWWLFDRLLSLYALGVAPRVRVGFSHAATIEQALSSLQQMNDRLADARTNAGARQLLELSIEECRKTALVAVRQQCWSVCTMMTPWKQETTLAVASVTARMLTAAAARPGHMLSFIPEHYLESALDMVHALRHTDGRVWESELVMALRGLQHVITCALTLVTDTGNRIISPDARSMLAQSISALISENEAIAVLARIRNGDKKLAPAVSAILADDRNWVGIAQALGTLCSKGGFACLPSIPVENMQRSVAREVAAAFVAEGQDIPEAIATIVAENHHKSIEDARQESPGDWVLSDRPPTPMQVAICRQLILRWLASCLAANPALAGAFFNSMFDHINWTVTEMLSLVDELPENATATATAPGGQSSPGLRRASATADLALRMLRTMEAIAERVPELLVATNGSGSANALNATRLAEVVAFGLRQLGGNSKAASVLHTTLVAQLQAAYLGIIAALQVEEKPETSHGDGATSVSASAGKKRSFAPALAAQGLPVSVIKQASEFVKEQAVNVVSAYLVGQTTNELLVKPNEPSLQRLESAMESLAAQRPAASASAGAGSTLHANASGGAAAGDGDTATSAAVGGAAEEDEAPSEFLDPIMQTVMDDPVVLPSSGITVDRLTIERHLLSSATDPFSRAPLTRYQLRTDEDLKQRIQEWREQRAAEA